jgi:hypothetical protein
VLHQLEKMEALLNPPDSDHRTDRMERFFLEYDRLLPLVERTRTLARTLTDSVGTFRVTFAPVDSVLLFAYAELEDQPTYYQYKIIRARPDTTLAIDMASGGCTKPGPNKSASGSGGIELRLPFPPPASSILNENRRDHPEPEDSRD